MLRITLLFLFSAILASPVLSQGFVKNMGQLTTPSGEPVKDVRFFAKVDGGIVCIRDRGISYVFTQVDEYDRSDKLAQPEVKSIRVDMNWFCASIPMVVIGSEPVSFDNYYLGDLKLEKVPVYPDLYMYDLYPGVDVHLQIVDGKFKYSYEFESDVNFEKVRWQYLGGDAILNEDGSEINLKTEFGELNDRIPSAGVMATDGKILEGKFQKIAPRIFGLQVEGDISNGFVFDPWATFIGATGSDEGYGIDYDGVAYHYAAGWTSSTNFPTTSGVIQQNTGGAIDGWVMKLDSTGNRIWSTYYGGSGTDNLYRVEVLPGGDPVITGYSNSSNLIMSNSGVFQTSHAGQTDGFLVRLSQLGTLVWGSYFGGSGSEVVLDMDIFSDGSIYFCGFSTSANLPITAGAYQDSLSGSNDAFLAKFDSTGNRKWATFLGGNSNEDAHAVHVDQNGDPLVGGDSFSPDFPVTGNTYQSSNAGLLDGYLFKFDSSGTAQWGTYIGGNDVDDLTGITTDANNEIYTIGYAGNSTYPTLGNALNAYNAANEIAIARWTPTGSLVWSGFYGGTGQDFGFWIDSDGTNMYAVGVTGSTNFPTFGQPVQNSNNGNDDAIYLKFDSTGTVWNASYLGGSLFENANECVYGPAGVLTMVGTTTSANFPVSSGTFQTTKSTSDDAYVYQFDANAGCFVNVAFSFANSGDTVSFTNNSTLVGGGSMLWTFGDGNSDTASSPTHIYSGGTSYTVCLKIISNCGTDSLCQQVSLCPPPVASWAWSVNGLTVSFKDSSLSANSWHWDFGDGDTSTMQSPLHTYSMTDTFLVCLTITDSCGSDSLCQSVIVDTVVVILQPNENWIKIYPNPADEYVTVESNRSPLRIEMFNAVGQRVYDTYIRGRGRLKTVGLPAGVYTIRANGLEFTEKIILR